MLFEDCERKTLDRECGAIIVQTMPFDNKHLAMVRFDAITYVGAGVEVVRLPDGIRVTYPNGEEVQTSPDGGHWVRADQSGERIFTLVFLREDKPGFLDALAQRFGLK